MKLAPQSASYEGVRRLTRPALARPVTCATLALVATLANGQSVPCPPAGATLEVELVSSQGASPVSAHVFGALAAPSCDDAEGRLKTWYAEHLDCDSSLPDTCRTDLVALRPGQWTHRVFVTEGGAAGQLQARERLLLDASAGQHVMAWPLYNSVITVTSLADGEGCAGCMREAIALAEGASRPLLIQFAPAVAGPIVLAAPLPPLATGDITIDALDFDGQPHARTVDGNGLDAAALKVTSANNTIYGLRVTNVGGNSDAVLIAGPEANHNVLESMLVVGRGLEICGDGPLGCVIDGVCQVPDGDTPQGVCGDDGVAVRDYAGTGGVNLIRNAEVIGAFDKAVKVSGGAVARVERSVIHENADGGLQATLSGRLSAIENLIERNRGTNSANGLAANGTMSDRRRPARLDTRGNISRENSLRGISVRGLSTAVLQDDYICGNGTAERDRGFGLAVLDAGGEHAYARVSGVAAVHNIVGGIVVSDFSRGAFGARYRPGNNAFAFNGSTGLQVPTNFHVLTPHAVPAIGNQWEGCGGGWHCDEQAVRVLDIFVADEGGAVNITPAQSAQQQRAPSITAIEPSFAAAGELVRIYGSGFDAINGNGPGASCETIADVNTCAPLRGNCVLIDRRPAEVIAVTPTMLAVRVPFTCVAPVSVAVRSRWGRGFGRASFCVVER